MQMQPVMLPEVWNLLGVSHEIQSDKTNAPGSRALLLVILLKVAHVEEILASGATQSPIRRILEHWASEMQMTS